MTRPAKTALYWIIGIATSLAGVAIVRLVAPQFDAKPSAILGSIGHIVALGGLVVIAFGVRQRVWAQSVENGAKTKPDSEKPDDSP
ncbi:hypothetical protein [Ereboglobus luteus]|uniref:Uncharacterized protein n=1 Tax=Ereboglobus luteus TaxID=1796921 RepID=A0A2U8E4V2_9BACT|nr:hypothetical protein [Ereboglobus luteus]AWI09881.1 hypothetical protein CKA38_12030 [Ereboglobus luteus]